MRVLKLTTSIDLKEVHENIVNASTIEELKRWQVLYITAMYDVTAEYLSDITGLSIPAVYLIIQRFNKDGIDTVGLKARGGRRRSLLSLEEEQSMMRELEIKASAGIILTAYDIRKHVEQKVGRPVSDDFLWDLFKRNGWVKQSPRPHHPKKNQKSQETFKKNSRTIWLPLQQALQKS